MFSNLSNINYVMFYNSLHFLVLLYTLLILCCNMIIGNEMMDQTNLTRNIETALKKYNGSVEISNRGTYIYIESKYPSNDTTDFVKTTSTKDASNNDIYYVGFTHDSFGRSYKKEDYDKLQSLDMIDEKSELDYQREGRNKRGVQHLYNMITCATGCNPIIYKGYGCFCGFMGSGRSVDGIDGCCQRHDRCYDNIYCPLYTVYLQPYLWQCINHTPYCAIENNSSSGNIINGCRARLCECDRQFAQCLRRYRCPRSRAPCRSSPIRYLQNLLLYR